MAEPRRVLVTGGSGGIGHAICAAFAARGDRVAFTWLLDHEGRERTVAAIGPSALALRANLRDAGGADALADAVLSSQGGVDVLVHAAATGTLRPAAELTAKQLHAVLEVNTRALLTLVQRLAPSMPAGGRVIALSSAGAERAVPAYTAVGISKAGLEALVRHLAVELGPKGITVNAVQPGLVLTKAIERFPDRQALIEGALARTPAGRLAEPADVAEAVCFLASPAAALITGQVLRVDGGCSIVA